MVKISAAIITFNEEHNIERCIKSIKGVVDEIIIIDSFSTDRTKEICLKYDVTFIENEFEGHIEQKNFAISLASNDYILSLDADEALDEDLKKSILSQKSTGLPQDGYYFNRLTIYVDKPIRHSGWYPDRKLRLFHKDKAKWSGTNPHDIIKMSQGTTQKYLKGDLIHYSYDSITDHVNQTNRFTTIAAKAAFKEGKRSSLFKIVTRPLFKFFRDYFFKRGFLDGKYGFIICYINSVYALLKYSKLKDLQDGRNID